MAKKKRNHKYNLIKAKRTYSVAQLAETLKIHPRTVQGWIKQGLPIIGKDGNSYLMLGDDIRRFLIDRNGNTRLKPESFIALNASSHEKACRIG